MLNAHIFSYRCYHNKENMPKVTINLLAFVIFALPFTYFYLSFVAFEILLNYRFAASNNYFLNIRIQSHTVSLG